MKEKKGVKMKNLGKNKRNNRAITLIALVVTIVVLLILAGISLNLVLGDNGIITRAQEAKTKTEASSATEEFQIYLTGVELGKIDDSNTRLSDYLSSNIGSDGIEDYINNGDGTAQVVYKGNQFRVDLSDYSVTYLGKGTSANRLIKQVLDNNNEDVPGIAMVEAGEIETEDLGWEVLSVNSDGTVNLIAKRNTGFEVSINGINGYTNGVKALNDICNKLYGGLEINGTKVISARSANYEDFYTITYKDHQYTSQITSKIQPYINTLDVKEDKFSADQITEYLDPENTSGVQASNTSQLKEAGKVTIRVPATNTANKTTASLISTGNNYWLATRATGIGWNSGSDGKTPWSESNGYEQYQMRFIRTDGVSTSTVLFTVNGTGTSGTTTAGSNGGINCALRPVITVSASSVSGKGVGDTVDLDPFYKGKEGTEAHGYVKASSISELLGTNVASVTYISSGLPSAEMDMTWTKLDGAYLQEGEAAGIYDTSKYDYYIADRATKLQVRLTGAGAYNNGVLAMDTICNNLYGNLTEITLSDGKTTKKVNVVKARNAKFEDFYDLTSVSGAYGALWTTNADDTTITNKITSTGNTWAPTLFAYESIDTTNVSGGYSDAKISSYILSSAGSSAYLGKGSNTSYAYEKNSADNFKVIYNALWGNAANRNTSAAKVSNGKDYWLSSRCVSAHWDSANFYLRYVSSGGTVYSSNVFYSNAGTLSRCRGLRPVLQVSKNS